jgi:hypothetical protein
MCFVLEVTWVYITEASSGMYNHHSGALIDTYSLVGAH